MQRISLNLVPGSVKPVVYASQYDKGRPIQFYVYNGDEIYNIPDGAWVICQGTKPDGKTFAYSSKDGGMTIAGSIITLTTTEQMTAVAGNTPCEFSIHEDGGTTLGTLNFDLSVENGTLPADADASLSDLAAYQNMVDRTQASETAAAASEKAAADSASKADASYQATVKEHADASADITSLHTAAVTAVQAAQTTAENSIESKRSSAVSEIQQLIDNFNSGNYYTEDITINPGDWSGTAAPYSYAIPNASDDMAVFLDIAEPGTTEDQMEAISAAGIYGSKGNVIYATGDKPDIAIPLRLVYLKGGN